MQSCGAQRDRCNSLKHKWKVAVQNSYSNRVYERMTEMAGREPLNRDNGRLGREMMLDDEIRRVMRSEGKWHGHPGLGTAKL
ncbi:hypothetical protein GQ42DRAFT_161335 [Ramicandelaber brevisporus]|nr:hypothetical protein GQ42DRAFT_161335 [Ramicandelaber brevisporus]